MQRMRKGFSSIVQVTLLTALSVISLFLIWGYVRDLSTDLDRTLSPTVDCLIQDSRVLNACINSQGSIETNLNIALGEKVSELKLIFKDETFICGSNQCTSCTLSNIEGKKRIYFDPQSQATNQDKLFVTINGCSAQELTLNSCPS